MKNDSWFSTTVDENNFCTSDFYGTKILMNNIDEKPKLWDLRKDFFFWHRFNSLQDKDVYKNSPLFWIRNKKIFSSMEKPLVNKLIILLSEHTGCICLHQTLVQ